MTKSPSFPVVILVRPQMGENIGAVARAMSNFGLTELRLVAPRDGWPNQRANEMASAGETIVNSAKLYDNVASAMAGIELAFATTARPRDMEKRVAAPDEAARETQQKKLKTAFLFGPERTGLENDDIVLCDAFITIPTAENASLNLAQSVVIVGYEWWKQQYFLPLEGGGSRRGGNAKKKMTPTHPSPFQGEGISVPAPKEDWQGLFTQLESYLDETKFFRVAAKKPVVWQNMRSMLLRGQFTAQEIRTLRGVMRVLREGRKPGSKI